MQLNSASYSIHGGAFGADVENKTVKAGDSLTLKTDIIKQSTEPILWYFNNTLIALINGDPRKSCLYDGEGGRFRDRLEVDYKTGSLTIKNITPEHTGFYEGSLIKTESSGESQTMGRAAQCDSSKVNRKTSTRDDIIKTFSVIISAVADSGVSSGIIAGVFAAVLLIGAVVGGVFYYRWQRS